MTEASKKRVVLAKKKQDQEWKKADASTQAKMMVSQTEYGLWLIKICMGT